MVKVTRKFCFALSTLQNALRRLAPRVDGGKGRSCLLWRRLSRRLPCVSRQVSRHVCGPAGSVNPARQKLTSFSAARPHIELRGLKVAISLLLNDDRLNNLITHAGRNRPSLSLHRRTPFPVKPPQFVSSKNVAIVPYGGELTAALQRTDR